MLLIADWFALRTWIWIQSFIRESCYAARLFAMMGRHLRRTFQILQSERLLHSHGSNEVLGKIECMRLLMESVEMHCPLLCIWWMVLRLYTACVESRRSDAKLFASSPFRFMTSSRKFEIAVLLLFCRDR